MKLVMTHEYEVGGVFSEAAGPSVRQRLIIDVSILHERTWNKMKTMFSDVVSPKSGSYLLGPISDDIILFVNLNFKE